MTTVKSYKGVNIYVQEDGTFYCNPLTNSKNYKEKTFHSKKITSIEKAIDDFKGGEVDGEIYYDISPYGAKIQELKVVRRVGDRIFFSDGSNKNKNQNLFLYPSSVVNTDEFKQLKEIFDKYDSLANNIIRLHQEQRDIIEKSRSLINKLKVVKVN